MSDIKSIAEKNRVTLRALEGSLCVFKEKCFVRLVRPTDVVTDDWGATLRFEIVREKGFPETARTVFKVSGSWEVLNISDRCVSAAWVGWDLIVRTDLVEQIRSFAPQAEDIGQVMNLINGMGS